MSYVKIKKYSDIEIKRVNCILNDGRYKVFYYPTGKWSTIVEVKDVIKESENIIDLCDGFIVEAKENPDNWFVMEIDEFKDKPKEDLLYSLKNWYHVAFIKTMKGLIYVARVNNDGELELVEGGRINIL